jgi:protein SCO1/2
MTMPIEAAFTLIDHHGAPVTENTYRGRWMLVFFGFTHCGAVCPRALRRISGVLDALGSRADEVQALYLTVDPARDTPPVMRAFLERDYPRFTGLSGGDADMNAAKKAFRVFARRKDDPDNPDGYAVPHTAITYLIDPSGGYAAHYADSVPADTVLADLRARLPGRIADQRRRPTPA